MKKTTTIAGKDFEEWAALAQSDPRAFEKMRQAAIDDYITSVPDAHQERLRRLQWRIEQERRLARTPMGACLRISRMMWDSLLGRGGLREQLQGLAGRLQGEAGERPSAALLSFERAAGQR